MKTTLKRGIAHRVPASSNGRGVFPPAPRTPMRRYRQAQPQARGFGRRIARVLAWALLAALIIVTAAAGALYLRAHQFVEAIAPHTAAERAAAKRLNVAIPGRPTIALLLGSDFRRRGDPAASGARSDTVMLIRADPRTRSISMLSLPRDLLTTIRCPGYAGRIDRINAAFAECGAVGTLLTVRALTGLPINYLITVNFRGFLQLVDHLGGIWLDVDQRYFNDHTGPGGYSAIDLQPGYQRLRALEALAFVRFRHTDSDIYRTARQQLFLRALKEQVSSSLSLSRLFDVISAMERSITIGRAGGKGIGLKTLADYLYFAYTLPPGHLVQARIQGLSGYNTLSASQADIGTAVQQFVNPDPNASKTAQALALRTRSQRPKLPPQRISVSVLNGNGVAGSAATASTELARRGYRIVLPPATELRNAPGFGYANTTVYFDRRRPSAREAAQRLAGLFAGAVVEPQTASIAPLANGALVAVVVGHSFDGRIASPVAEPTPTREPANVIPGLGVTLPALHRLQHRVPFPLEAPRLIERDSVPDPAEPVRLYTIVRGHEAAYLTFRSGVFDYWGIEETDWNRAPALMHANFMRRIGRREFSLYYSGSRLHMVVLRQGGVSYWVVNSLLDALSNETMLAIAEGLVPMNG